MLPRARARIATATRDASAGAAATPGSARPPAAAPLAQAVFGAHFELACRYADWLAGPGTQRGLLGPREAERLWDRHLLNCAAVSALIAPNASVVDIGSGAGLPGLVLAIARPDLRLVLVESMARRVAFLTEVVADLGLGGVAVEHVRAEDVAGLRCDIATARAVAPIGRLAGWAAPLVPAGGLLLALTGSTGAAEFARHAAAVVRAGFEPAATLVGVHAEAPVFGVARGGRGDGSGGRDHPVGGAMNVVVEARWRDAGWQVERPGRVALPGTDVLGSGAVEAGQDDGAPRLARVLRLVRSGGSRGRRKVV